MFALNQYLSYAINLKSYKQTLDFFLLSFHMSTPFIYVFEKKTHFKQIRPINFVSNKFKIVSHQHIPPVQSQLPCHQVGLQHFKHLLLLQYIRQVFVTIATNKYITFGSSFLWQWFWENYSLARCINMIISKYCYKSFVLKKKLVLIFKLWHK